MTSCAIAAIEGNMRELKIGIVGLGWVAGAHIETFKKIEGVAVRAICSRRKLDENKLAEAFGIPVKSYSGYSEMLADPEIDIIDICTPHPYHARQAIEAAEVGKHLIIEKPIALNYDDLLAVRQAIARSGVRVCVCFECRFSQHFTLIRSCIDQGLLGELHYAEVDYYHGIGPWYRQFPWNVKKEFGGSSLLTAGCHALDGLLWFMDSDVLEVTTCISASKNAVFEPYEYPTTTVTLLKFADGKIGKVASVIDCLQPYYFHIHLVGSEGSLLDNRIYSSRLPGLTKNRWSVLETSLIDSGDVTDHPYLPQFKAFIDAVHQDTEMPLTNFDIAFETHRVVLAADRSGEISRPVKLEEFPV